MKQCPVCRRIYTDDIYSFCLEDGSVLSEIYQKEQVTVLKKGEIRSAPEKVFLPDEHSEVPTVFFKKIASPPPVPQPGSKINTNFIVLPCLAGFFLLSALYTRSIVPLMTGSVVLAVYAAIWLIIRRAKK